VPHPGANLTFKAQEKAKENAGKFIEKIGLKVKALEDDYTIPKERTVFPFTIFYFLLFPPISTSTIR
jgi:pimeloyl-CoA synthetase